MSDGLKRSASRGDRDINDLLKNIRGIINDNNKVLGDCKTIQRKNNDVKNTKRFVDIVALTSGRKKNEIDIPHNTSVAGELQGQIIKHALRDNQEIPGIATGPDTPIAPVYFALVHTEPSTTDEERERRREKRAMSREASRDRIDRLAWLNERDTKPRPPRRSSSSTERRRSLSERRSTRTITRDTSHSTVTRSCETNGTTHTDRSRPRTRSRTLSQGSDGERPVLGIRIRKDSDNSIDIVPEYVTENHVVYESVTPPCSPYSTRRSDRASPVRSPGRDKGYMNKVLSRSDSLAEILKDKYFVETNEDDYHSELGDRSRANSTNHSRAESPHSTISRDYSPHGRSRRRIVLERCRDCDGGDSPPEIEIKICSKDICVRNYRFTPGGSNSDPLKDKENTYRPSRDVSPEKEDSLPEAPQRSSSFGKVPNKRPHSPSALELEKTNRRFEKRPQSPSSIEVEKMSRRLERLKKDVETLARQNAPSPTYKSSVPLSVRVSSPVQRDGRNKTTSTSDILTYHPAKEELLAQSISEESRTRTPSSNTVISTQTEKSSTSELEVVSTPIVVAVQNSPPPPPLPERAPFTPPPTKRNSMSKINYDTNEDLPPPMPPRNIASPKSYTDLLSAPSSPKPAAPKSAPEITLIPENLYDPMHIGTTYMLLSKKYHGMFKFSNPDDPNDTKTPPTPTLKPTPSKRTLYQPKSYAPSPKPAIRDQPARSELYTPYSLSMTSLPRPHSPPTKLEPEPAAEPHYDSYDPSPRSPADDPRYVSVLPAVPSPAMNRKYSTDSVPMSPESRRKFNRPYKSDTNYREVAVDCGAGAPPDLINAPQKTPVLERRDPALRQYMLSDLARDQRPPVRDGLSPDCGYTREPLPFSSPSLYNSQSSLRMQIPNVKFANDGQWKDLAQCLGFDNMTISNISSEYPNPGLAMIEMWAKQSGSELEELMYHLKRMGMWNTADTLERTVSPISV